MSSATRAAGPIVPQLADRSAHAGACRAGAVLFMAALTAALAQVAVPLPFTPVPLTLQPVVVLLGGLVLGSRLALSSQLLYLAAGAAGLPVFAAAAWLGPGPARLVGPTAGYLLSYPLAAFIVGRLAERGFDRRYLSSVVAMLAGLAIIFAGGVTWLALWPPAPIGFAAAAAAGLQPFLFADITKVLVAAASLPAFRRLIGRTPGS